VRPSLTARIRGPFYRHGAARSSSMKLRPVSRCEPQASLIRFPIAAAIFFCTRRHIPLNSCAIFFLPFQTRGENVFIRPKRRLVCSKFNSARRHASPLQTFSLLADRTRTRMVLPVLQSRRAEAERIAVVDNFAANEWAPQSRRRDIRKQKESERLPRLQ
jgi:hypothetical protein